MKLKDLNIGIRLRLGFGVILALLAFIGALAWVQADILWQETKGLYDHPFMVRKAIGEVKADILSMQRGMKDLCLTDDLYERQAIFQSIDFHEADAFRQLAIVFDRYLGPKSDVEEAYRDFVQWKALRAETIRLLREGKKDEVVSRTKAGGSVAVYVEQLLGHVEKISEFAEKRAEKFYLTTKTEKQTLNRQLVIVVAAALLLAALISWLLTKGVREPLKELSRVIGEYRQGRIEARSQYLSPNEFGTLSEAFNTLADTIQSEMAFKERMAQLNTAMLRALDARAFNLHVLDPLMQLTGSQAGAIYLLNNHKTGYEHLESIGLAPAGRAPFQAATYDGEFGAALATRRIQRITAIPADTRFTFSAVSGDFSPREIITIPLLSGQEVPAVVSLASLHGYDAAAIRLVTDLQSSLAAWMNSMLANRRIESLTEGLEHQNRELQAQQEELKITNEELEEQTQRLQESEEKLKAKQNELEMTNAELEEKNDLLERQKKEVELARRKIEEKAGELALASKYKSEFLANMSHELRTPLNSLLLLAQNLSQNRDGNLSGEQVEAARIIHRSGGDLLTLINEILDLSKIEAGRIELRIDTVQISDLAEGVRESFQHLADEKGIGLDIVVAADAPREIASDHKRIEQIIRNLTANAIKFTDTGSVTVTFSRPAPGAGLAADSCLAVAVRDTGIGIPPELHKVIFEAFQQADGSTSRKYGGTGLGLSISRELATLLGGEIQLESKPGSGSVFTLYLPVEPAARGQAPKISPPVEARAAKREAAAAGGVEARIADDRDSIEPSDRVMLVIEDDPDFARLLYETCRKKGLKCLIAPTGEAGLELAARYLPCAVILDLRLPGMDGWGVLSALKENTRTRHIPVHIVSVEEATTESLRKGAVGHVTKPVSQEEIEEAFRRLEQVSTSRPKRLLVVDDDATGRRETVKLIGNGDVKVDEAGNGEQALAALRSGLYDCVVLALELPDMEGGELLARLDREGVAIPPVVIHTARDLTLDEESALRERADSIVIKDVRSQERLLDEVSLFLHRVVSQMSEKKRKVIQDLHETDTILKGRTVLVVDDDMRTTFALSRLLADCGVTPLKAENGERALRILEEHPDVDLVLMDIMMPMMDGYETMRRIRAQERFRRLPIIALTAKAMPEDREKSLAAGANDYLPKPLNQERLFSMMRVWLCR